MSAMEKELYAVRWSEVGFAPRITEFGENSAAAWSFYDMLVKVYKSQEREGKPTMLIGTLKYEEVPIK